jgi:hypothetical protein
MLELQRNVPPPTPKPISGNDGRKKYPIKDMKIGDFFFVPDKRRETIRTYFAARGTQLGIKLKSEQIHAFKNDGGQWERCPETMDGAVSGVGVWRVA